MKKVPRVFVSMGTPYTQEYMQFRDALDRLLRDHCHVDPRIIGRNEYPAGTPIQHINDTIRTCDGVMIVAYERKRVDAGLEKPGGSDQRAIDNSRYTTPWNHIESAVAYAHGLPLYVIAQRGLTSEGLIEPGDWYVQHMDFTEESLRRPEVIESISSWIRERVTKAATRRRWPLQNFMKLRARELTVEEWMILTGLVISSFGAGWGFAKMMLPLCVRQ